MGADKLSARFAATAPAAARPAAEPSAPPALRVCGLGCRYAKAEVFSGVSFELDAGSIAFLTGPNGAGKSTLLRCLAGWDAPGEGGIELCGEPFDGTKRAQRRSLAFVPDAPVFYDDLTAGEHIDFVLRANRVPKQDDQAGQLMEVLGLAAHRDQYPSAYSRGMRQKLALVLALAIRPRVLLLDEPYGPLDRAASKVLSGLLDAVRASGSAALVSCHHDVPDLRPDALLHLADGRLALSQPGAPTAPPAAPHPRAAELGRG